MESNGGNRELNMADNGKSKETGSPKISVDEEGHSEKAQPGSMSSLGEKIPIDDEQEAATTTQNGMIGTGNDRALNLKEAEKSIKSKESNAREATVTCEDVFQAVKSEPQADRLKRKRALLRTMLHKSQNQLESLSNRAESSIPLSCPPVNCLEGTPLDLSRAPPAGVVNDILRPFEVKKNPLVNDSTESRPDYTSLTLKELESKTMAQYRAVPSAKTTVHAFPLQFNEVSISALANWGMPVPGSKNVSSIKKIAVDSTHRMCGICGGWGHYEIECTRLTEEQAVQFGQGFVAKAEKGQNRTDEKPLDYEAVFEECSGYTIEQRSEPVPDPRRVAVAEIRLPQPKTEKQQTVLDGLLITASDGRKKLSAQLRKGDFVVWLSEESGEQNKDVHAGVILRYNASKRSARVHVVETIPASPRPRKEQQQGHCRWISEEVLVRVPPRKARTRKYARRNLSTKKDEILETRFPPRKRPDGTFVAPAGRKPKGYAWSHSKGVWILVDPRTNI